MNICRCSCVTFIFRRSGNDLIMRMHVELVEALCGLQRVIKTLDDRDLVITAIPGELCF
jgi:DnaJ family protein A protein 1